MKKVICYPNFLHDIPKIGEQIIIIIIIIIISIYFLISIKINIINQSK